jgi:hypothetical protein
MLSDSDSMIVAIAPRVPIEQSAAARDPANR